MLTRFQPIFVVETDASDFVISGVLTQANQPIAYFSLMLNSALCNYPIHNHELLAVIKACKQWRPYLAG